jgi:hypothetical protein
MKVKLIKGSDFNLEKNVNKALSDISKEKYSDCHGLITYTGCAKVSHIKYTIDNDIHYVLIFWDFDISDFDETEEE